MANPEQVELVVGVDFGSQSLSFIGFTPSETLDNSALTKLRCAVQHILFS